MGSGLEQRMTKYLLWRLSEPEEAELESRLLEDNGVFEELLATEADLRDAYEQGELSGPDREAFAQRLLASPRQEERQAFVRALRSYRPRARAAGAPNPMQRLRVFFQGSFRVTIPAMAAAMVVLIAGIWWWSHKSAVPSGSPPMVVQQNPQPEGRTLTVALVGS